MRDNLLQWQWSLYPDNHQRRKNLVLHIVTVPMFLGGSLAVLSSPLLGAGSAGVGLGAMVIALIAQGRGHKGEHVAPVPFDGPLDGVSRFFVEQWVTFPRFVLSGAFARAWKQSAAKS